MPENKQVEQVRKPPYASDLGNLALKQDLADQHLLICRAT
jgi:hypothetical protein